VTVPAEPLSSGVGEALLQRVANSWGEAVAAAVALALLLGVAELLGPRGVSVAFPALGEAVGLLLPPPLPLVCSDTLAVRVAEGEAPAVAVPQLPPVPLAAGLALALRLSAMGLGEVRGEAVPLPALELLGGAVVVKEGEGETDSDCSEVRLASGVLEADALPAPRLGVAPAAGLPLALCEPLADKYPEALVVAVPKPTAPVVLLQGEVLAAPDCVPRAVALAEALGARVAAVEGVTSAVSLDTALRDPRLLRVTALLGEAVGGAEELGRAMDWVGLWQLHGVAERVPMALSVSTTVTDACALVLGKEGEALGMPDEDKITVIEARRVPCAVEV
jgi:hypothetical protein